MDLMCILGMREHIHAVHEKVLVVESQPVQAADVILAISKLKNTKSTGHDQINLQHVKESHGYNPIYYINYQNIDIHKGISETVEALYYNTNP